MTLSDRRTARPPDRPPPGDEWKPVPGARYYEASHRGQVRSVDRVIGGKRLKGVVLKTRLNNSDPPYKITNIRDDAGEVVTVTVHSAVLRAHDREPEPGEECCHGPGGAQDNRFPENIRWGTRAENEADKAASRPPREPKPPAPCINHDRCGGHAVRGGRRCHACRVELGRAAAMLLEGGADPEQVARALNSGSPNGVYRAAVQLGGLRCYIAGDKAAPRRPVVIERERDYAPSRPSWLRRVLIRWQAWLADSDAQ